MIYTPTILSISSNKFLKAKSRQDSVFSEFQTMVNPGSSSNGSQQQPMQTTKVKTTKVKTNHRYPIIISNNNKSVYQSLQAL